MDEGFLYYEVRTQGLDAQGKTIKDDFLVKSDMLINAVYAALQTAKTDICLKANVSGIREIVNENDVQKEKRYIVTVEDSTSDHKLKYKMFMYADDIDDARKIISEYKHGDTWRKNGCETRLGFGIVVIVPAHYDIL